MAQLRFSLRMDPTKQLKREVPEEKQWGESWWNFHDRVQELCGSNMPYPQAKAEAARQTGWQ